MCLSWNIHRQRSLIRQCVCPVKRPPPLLKQKILSCSSCSEVLFGHEGMCGTARLKKEHPKFIQCVNQLLRYLNPEAKYTSFMILKTQLFLLTETPETCVEA